MEKARDWKADVDMYLRRQDTVAAAEAMGEALKKETRWEDREHAFAGRLLGIYEEERRAGEEHTVLDEAGNIDEAISHFVWVKLLLRRLEFGLPEEYWQEMYHYCEERQVSVTMLSSILKINVIHREETCKHLISLYEKNEGKQSGRARDFQGLLREFGEAGKQDGR